MKNGIFWVMCAITCVSIFLNSCSSPTEVAANRKSDVVQNSTSVVDIDEGDAQTWVVTVYPKTGERITAVVGTHIDIPVDIMNKSSDKSLRIRDISLAGDVSDFSIISIPSLPLVLNKKGSTGDIAQVVVRYSPTKTNKVSDVQLLLSGKNKALPMASIKAMSSSSDTISSDDYPEYFVADPDTQQVFVGPALLGESAQLAYTIKNTSSSWMYIPSATLSGPNSSLFSYSGVTFPLYLEPGESKVMQLNFTPASAGYVSAGLHFGTKIMVTVFGVGNMVGINDYYNKTGLKLDSELDFGKVPVGQEVERTIAIENTSNHMLWIHHHTITEDTPNMGDFTIVAQSPIVYPNLVSPGQSIRYTISYKPSVAQPALLEIYLGDKSNGTPRYNLIKVTGEGQ